MLTNTNLQLHSYVISFTLHSTKSSSSIQLFITTSSALLCPPFTHQKVPPQFFTLNLLRFISNHWTHRKPSCLNQSFQKVFLLLFKYSCLHFHSISLPCPTHPTSHTQSCPSLALPFPFFYALCAVTMSVLTVCYSVFPNMFVIVSMCPEEPLCLPSGRLLVPQMGLM